MSRFWRLRARDAKRLWFLWYLGSDLYMRGLCHGRLTFLWNDLIWLCGSLNWKSINQSSKWHCFWTEAIRHARRHCFVKCPFSVLPRALVAFSFDQLICLQIFRMANRERVSITPITRINHFKSSIALIDRSVVLLLASSFCRSVRVASARFRRGILYYSFSFRGNR